MFLQFFSEQFGIVFGKLQTLDGALNAFASGRGKSQCLNLNFVATPVTLRTIPYSALGGGIIVLPTKTNMFSLTALDPNGTPDQAGFDDAFDNSALLHLAMNEALITD